MNAASDRYQFNCVWKGAWYKLGSLSDHLKYKVDPTGPTWLLIDKKYRRHIVPREEVTISQSPVN